MYDPTAVFSENKLPEGLRKNLSDGQCFSALVGEKQTQPLSELEFGLILTFSIGIPMMVSVFVEAQAEIPARVFFILRLTSGGILWLMMEIR